LAPVRFPFEENLALRGKISYAGGFAAEGWRIMGFEHRDYYREDDHSGYRGTGSDLTITYRLIITCVAVFLINLFFFSSDNKLTEEILALDGETLRKPWLWFQFLTYGFAHQPKEVGHILWNMVALFFFGSAMEQRYGRREYLRFYLVTILLGGLLWGLRTWLQMQGKYAEFLGPLSAELYGAEAGVTALTLLFCLHNPQQNIMLMGVLPVPAWLLGAIVILTNVGVLFGWNIRSGGLAADPGVMGVAFTILYFRFGWSLSDIPGLDWITSWPRYWQRLWRPRPQLKVYSRDADDEDDDAVYVELERQADKILAKLHREGEASLSKQERQLLEKYSRIMRQKHR
jgi:membrane associated rhomboid family serine protease